MDGRTSAESRKWSLQARHWITGLISLPSASFLWADELPCTLCHKEQLLYGSTFTILVALVVKNLPAMWETWFQSLGWEDPLEKGTASHSSILAWRISWTEEPDGHDLATFTFTFFPLGSLCVPNNDWRRLILRCIMITFFKFHRKKNQTDAISMEIQEKIPGNISC